MYMNLYQLSYYWLVKCLMLLCLFDVVIIAIISGDGIVIIAMHILISCLFAIPRQLFVLLQ